jgi:hypothetical protein
LAVPLRKSPGNGYGMERTQLDEPMGETYRYVAGFSGSSLSYSFLTTA